MYVAWFEGRDFIVAAGREEGARIRLSVSVMDIIPACVEHLRSSYFVHAASPAAYDVNTSTLIVPNNRLASLGPSP